MSQRKLFGTDGVRGKANKYPMTADLALKLGAAVGNYFGVKKRKQVRRVVIGKDTRRSGYMFEYALTAGLTSAGMDVLLLGPVPTPAVGLLTTSMRADLGIMVSASHNPHSDNGIKFFGPEGFKLSDEVEAEIEDLLEKGVDLVQPNQIGRAQRIDDGRFRYIERVKSSFPDGMKLNNIKVVIDCANGAAYKAAPEVLWELGAEVIPVGVSPNGMNINRECGSTNPNLAAESVLKNGADVGICLDGDGDRLVVIDENGRIANGDQLMGLLALRWANEEKLIDNVLVSTIMSNTGLEKFLNSKNIFMERTKVGDRYVVERMIEKGYSLGGEPSGHIVMTEYSTTGDGLMAGLQFLAEIIRTGKPSSELLQVFTPLPQLQKSVRFKEGRFPLENSNVKRVINDVEAKISSQGRLIIRMSGTEPLIRIMAESEDVELLNSVVREIENAITNL